jgi:hypothetical protein
VGQHAAVALLAMHTKKTAEDDVVNFFAREQEYLQQHSYPQDKQKAVLDIIQGIGFKVQSRFPAISCNCLPLAVLLLCAT